VTRLGLALACLVLSACATFKAHDPFRNPDGTLNVRKIVLYVSYGVEADCALGESTLSQQICTYGREAIETVNAISTNDPVYFKKSVESILQHAAHDHPPLQPYFEFALKILATT
jgi:hypothetical protein